jgi:hypothetical protein
MTRRIIAICGLILALAILVGSIAFVLFAPTSPITSPFKTTAVARGTTATSPPTANGGTPGGGSTPIKTGNNCGVTKTTNGYTFSWLSVANGNIVDANNCVVRLKGFNWSQLEFGNAVGGGPKTRISEAAMAWYTQTFHMNVWRIPINSDWWNSNVDVPLAHMQYQAWIEQVVQWAEQNGDYVILTKGPQFPNPPCGGTIKYCPPQDQGTLNVQAGVAGPEETTTGQYTQPAIQMWTSIAKIYANDPAVLYDSWNEMHDIDAQTWKASEESLIATIRAQNPRSLIFLGGPNFKGNINALVQGQVPDFTEPNLVYDFHVYDGFSGTYMGKNCVEPLSYVARNWPTMADQQVGYAQQHGKAVSFTEWGGCDDLATYNQNIVQYAQAHAICLAYYDETNVAVNTNGTYQLTPNGMLVVADYAAL